MTLSYADEKVLFVSNGFGASLTRVTAISSISVATYALFACCVRLSFAHSRLRTAHAHGEQSQAHGIYRLLDAFRAAYAQRKTNTSSSAKVLVIDFVTIVVPLVLSITFASGTFSSLACTSVLLSVSAIAYRQARRLEAQRLSQSRKARSRDEPPSSFDDEDGNEQTELLRSQSRIHQGDQTGLTNRRRAHEPDARRGTRSSRRSYSESDDEERELEELDRIEAKRRLASSGKRSHTHTRDGSMLSGSPPPGFRVSVESAADQAYKYANAPETWATSSEGPGDLSLSRSSSVGSVGSGGMHRSDSARRGLGLGLGLGLKPSADAKQLSELEPNRASRGPGRDAFLTVYRAHMMLITIACILAVDFPVFPRELGKCETWGASLMDMGVGSFVFSLGIVSAAPYLERHADTSTVKLSLLKTLQRDIIKSIPLVILGLVRVVSVKTTSYPEHVTEYGVHWSFFLTLAAMPVLKTLAGAVRSLTSGRWSTFGLCIAAVHQVQLTFGNLERSVLDPTIDRHSSFIAANREGLVSLPGYLAILLLAIDLGLYILPPTDPYLAFRRVQLDKTLSHDRQTSTTDDSDAEEDEEHSENGATGSLHPTSEPTRSHIRTRSDGLVDVKGIVTTDRRIQARRLRSLVAILASWAIIYWASLSLCGFALSFRSKSLGELSSDSGLDRTLSQAALGRALEQGASRTFTLVVSRRLANLPYVLWVAAFNATFLAGFTAVYWYVLHDVRFDSEAEEAERTAVTAATWSGHTSSLVQADDAPPLAPYLLELINAHSLPVFLIANLLTGVINLTSPTMHLSAIPAMLILLGYLSANVAAIVVLERSGLGSALRKLTR